jgi:ABC-2 type transport system permease protein
MERASLTRIAALIRKELRQMFRDPKTKRIVFGSPIIQLLLFGNAVTTDVHNIALFVVDHDRTAESRAVVSALTSSGYFRVTGSSDRAADLGRALDRGDAVVGVELPAGFSRDLLAGGPARVQILVDGTQSNTATVAQGYAMRIVQDHAATAARAAGPLAVAPGGVTLESRAWFNPALESRMYNVPAILGVLLLLMCLLLTSLAVVRERELGTLEQLMVSPLSAGELIVGKTAPVAIIALIDLALITAVAILWFRVPFHGSAVALVLASSVYILAALGLGLFISTISRTQQEAFMTMFLMMLPAIILSGFMYPIDAMPVFFQHLTQLNPVRHFLEVVRAIFLRGDGVREIWPKLIVLTTMAALLLRAATVRFALRSST